MKRIILVVGDHDDAAQAKIASLVAESPADRVVTRTPIELQMALAAGHTAVIRTLRAILPVREAKARDLYPTVPLEVVDVDA